MAKKKNTLAIALTLVGKNYDETHSFFNISPWEAVQQIAAYPKLKPSVMITADGAEAEALVATLG